MKTDTSEKGLEKLDSRAHYLDGWIAGAPQILPRVCG